MRSPRSFKNSCWVALMALVLPISQSQAQECVKSDGLNVCPIGKAQVTQLDASTVQLNNLGDTGTDGAAISLGQATDWAAAYEASSSDGSQRTTFTAVSDGAPISTTTSRKVGDARELSATFTGSGADSTYTLQAYLGGVLQAEVRGIQSGRSGALIHARAINSAPSCRGWRQSVPDCRDACRRQGFSSCAYCDIECERAIKFKNDRAVFVGACQWTISQESSPVVLADGNTVEADAIVMTEEVRGAGSYPYLNFEKILLQASGGTAVLGNQTVTQSE